MASNVNVLCPNGRRQTVKVSPNTRILEIIETVCQKQKFNADDFNLKHQRTVLDVKLPFRYANLPNNAKLELVKSDTPRSECGSTTIALQLSSGERLQHSFDSTRTLWDILQHWEQESSDRPSLTCPSSSSGSSVHPVCIYMREEIIGEDWLKATTLRSLGLTGGRAIIRLLHREVELPPPPKVPQSKTKSDTPSSPAEEMVSPVTTHSTTDVDQSMDLLTDSPTVASGSHASAKSNTSALTSVQIEPSQSAEGTSDKGVDLTPCDDVTESAMEIDSNPLLHESLPSTSSQSEERIVRPKENVRPSMSTGEKEVSNEEKTDQIVNDIEKTEGLRLDEYARKRIQNLLEKEEEMVQSMETAMTESLLQSSQEMTKPRKMEHKPSNKPFQNFKFPDKKPEELIHAGKVQVKQDENLKPCERSQIVFSPNQDSFSIHDDVPDQFFDLTVDDVRRMISDLKHQSCDSEKPLETQAMRDAKDQVKMRKYEKVVVRVHFPDRLILQGFFRPQETVQAVKEFVRSNLADQQLQFYLYTTPPKMILSDMTQTLFKAKLFPAALVHFGTNTPRDQYLHEEALGDLTSLSQADSVVAHNMKTGVSSSLSSDNSAGTSTWSVSEDRPSASGSGSMTSQQKRQASPSNSALGSTKVPKWFKIGKK